MSLQESLEDYLALRRSLGFKLERQGQLLADFVRHLEQSGSDLITIDLALAWARQPAAADPYWWGARLSAVRVFTRYLRALDPRHQIPADDLLPVPSRRATPYLYSDAEVVALMAAAGSLRHPLRAATYATYIGLLAATGMRAGEAIALDRADIEWPESLLVVRSGKFGKSREVVLHPTTMEALHAYDQLRRHHCPHPPAAAFFVSVRGTRLIYKNVHFVFHRLVRQLGLEARSPHCRPRPHDLRHTFAVNTLVSWYRAGVDVGARIHLLSTYLGHRDPADTFWYLSATPELLGLTAQRLEQHLGGVL